MQRIKPRKRGRLSSIKAYVIAWLQNTEIEAEMVRLEQCVAHVHRCFTVRTTLNMLHLGSPVCLVYSLHAYGRQSPYLQLRASIEDEANGGLGNPTAPQLAYNRGLSFFREQVYSTP